MLRDMRNWLTTKSSALLNLIGQRFSSSMPTSRFARSRANEAIQCHWSSGLLRLACWSGSHLREPLARNESL